MTVAGCSGSSKQIPDSDASPFSVQISVSERGLFKFRTSEESARTEQSAWSLFSWENCYPQSADRLFLLISECILPKSHWVSSCQEHREVLLADGPTRDPVQSLLADHPAPDALEQPGRVGRHLRSGRNAVRVFSLEEVLRSHLALSSLGLLASLRK